MKAALFGEQVDSFNEAIVYNGQYIISNALIKLIEERWRNNSDELPFQVTFGGQTVVQRVNSEGTIDGPMFQSIQSFSRILMPGTKYGNQYLTFFFIFHIKNLFSDPSLALKIIYVYCRCSRHYSFCRR